MAAIDKIYGTLGEWIELRMFLKKNKPKYIENMYSMPNDSKEVFPLSNFTKEQDMWLLKNCNIEFVQKAIKQQYNLD